MLNFIIKKRTQGYYKIEVIIDHEFRGEFQTSDTTLIDDVSEWLDGGNEFYNYTCREELEIAVKTSAGISNVIGGVDFTDSVNQFLNLKL